jgi:hypothetical protein
MPPKEKEDAEMNLTWSRVLAIGVVAVRGRRPTSRSSGWPTLSTAISMSREMDVRFWLEKADADRDT